MKKSNVTFFDQTPPSIMHFVHSEEELYCLTQQQVIFICGHSLKESIKMFLKRFLKSKHILKLKITMQYAMLCTTSKQSFKVHLKTSR